MTDAGVFAVSRAVFDHPLFADGEPFTKREAWLWLVSEAAWKPRQKAVQGHIIELQRGQLCHSIRFIAAAWKWPKTTVARFLGRLKTETMIGTADSYGQTLITICNYSEYQRIAMPRSKHSGTENGTDVGQERDKRESIKTLNTPIVPKGTSKGKAIAGYDDMSDPLYAEFYTGVWEKRWLRPSNNPLKAFLAYSKLTPVQREKCRAAIERCAKAITAERSEAKYRPMMSSWINQRGWEAVESTPSKDQPKSVDWAMAAECFRKHVWNMSWGPRPGDPGCKMPQDMQAALIAA